MRELLFLTLLFIFYIEPVQGYIDTTPKNFSKPKPAKATPYKYTQSKYDKYVDIASEKVAPRVFSSFVTGPAGVIINLSDKAIKYQENKEASKSSLQ